VVHLAEYQESPSTFPVCRSCLEADLAFRFPFSNGITEILLNAHSYLLAGYVRGGVQTVFTKTVTVSGPGSVTPVTVHPTLNRELLPPRTGSRTTKH
jgi:hypothetical protein